MSTHASQHPEPLPTVASVPPDQPWIPVHDAAFVPWQTVVTWLGPVVRSFVPWVVPVLLLVLWHISAVNGWLSTRVLPAPLDVLSAAWTLASQPRAATVANSRPRRWLRRWPMPGSP